MAKYTPRQKQYETGQTVTTKSRYGSHEEMVVSDDEELEGTHLSTTDEQVVCKDDTGYYITLKSRLDNGLADPNRYSSHRKK